MGVGCWALSVARDDASDARDLTQVQKIVAGVQPSQVTEALFSSFAMDADTFEIVGRCAIEEPHRGASKDAEPVDVPNACRNRR